LALGHRAAVRNHPVARHGPARPQVPIQPEKAQARPSSSPVGDARYLAGLGQDRGQERQDIRVESAGRTLNPAAASMGSSIISHPAACSSRSMACLVSFRCIRDPMCCQMTTLNPMTETTSPARLIQSPTVIFTGSSTVNLEKGRATFVLFLGDTTCGAERDLGARMGLLPLAISQPPISQTGDVALPPPIIDGRHSLPTRREPGTGLAQASQDPYRSRLLRRWPWPQLPWWLHRRALQPKFVGVGHGSAQRGPQHGLRTCDAGGHHQAAADRTPCFLEPLPPRTSAARRPADAVSRAVRAGRRRNHLDERDNQRAHLLGSSVRPDLMCG
jgi:hypothetical protein